MRILGIDPGLDITGYGVIEVEGRRIKLIEAGVIKTSHKQPLEDRLNEIYDGLIEVIKETSPGIGVIEKLYSHYKHPVTSILMGHGRGVVYLAVKKSNIELFECPAKTVKKALTSNGNASKEQVGRMVQAYLNLKQAPSPVDVSDALALAMTHAFKSVGTPCGDFAQKQKDVPAECPHNKRLQ